MYQARATLGWFGRILFYFTEPAAYHCKPLGSNHEWVRLDNLEYPVCKKCKKICWWRDGYILNSGTILSPDFHAQRVQRRGR
jgi:hypothetical protein